MQHIQFDETLFDVFAPAGKNDHGIDAASAIVAGTSQRGLDRVKMYYEGNRLGACNLVDFIDRCRCAAGRAATRYPTIAFGVFDPADFVRVAVYDLANHRFTEVLDSVRLTAWAREQLSSFSS